MGKFERSLDELFDRGARQGARQVLGQLATRRFGEETAGRLVRLLEELSEPEDIDRVSERCWIAAPARSSSSGCGRPGPAKRASASTRSSNRRLAGRRPCLRYQRGFSAIWTK